MRPVLLLIPLLGLLLSAAVVLSERRRRRSSHRDGVRLLRLLELCAGRPVYGLTLMDVTGMGPGRFYPAIRRLERCGLVVGSWQPGPVPRRRMYELAP